MAKRKRGKKKKHLSEVTRLRRQLARATRESRQRLDRLARDSRREILHLQQQLHRLEQRRGPGPRQKQPAKTKPRAKSKKRPTPRPTPRPAVPSLPRAYTQRVYRDKFGRFLSKEKARRRKRPPRREPIERRPFPKEAKHLKLGDGTRISEADYQKLRPLFEWMIRQGYTLKSFKTVEEIKGEYAAPTKRAGARRAELVQRQAELQASRMFRPLREERRAS